MMGVPILCTPGNVKFVLLTTRVVHDGIRYDQWPDFLAEILRILKPGTGWIQSAEPGVPYVRCDDGSAPKDAPIFKVRILIASTINASFGKTTLIAVER